MSTLPLVSVCVQTYNHAAFIGECLDSIVSQQTSFPFEIVLGEDESSDDTRKLCIEYAERWPLLIRLILRSRKDVIYIDGRATGRFNLIENLKAAKGKYIALCEGDDFWTDATKLQKQVDFLEANPGYSWCFHHAQQLQGTTGKRTNFYEKDLPDDFTTADILSRSGGFFHTGAVMFRRDALQSLPVFFSKIRASDWALLLIASLNGKGKLLHRNMSVHRVHQGGLFSSIKHNELQRIKAFRSDIHLIREFNKMTDGKFERLANDRIKDVKRKIIRRYARHYMRKLTGLFKP